MANLSQIIDVLPNVGIVASKDIIAGKLGSIHDRHRMVTRNPSPDCTSEELLNRATTTALTMGREMAVSLLDACVEFDIDGDRIQVIHAYLRWFVFRTWRESVGTTTYSQYFWFLQQWDDTWGEIAERADDQKFEIYWNSLDNDRMPEPPPGVTGVQKDFGSRCYALATETFPSFRLITTQLTYFVQFIVSDYNQEIRMIQRDIRRLAISKELGATETGYLLGSVFEMVSELLFAALYESQTWIASSNIPDDEEDTEREIVPPDRDFDSLYWDAIAFAARAYSLAAVGIRALDRSCEAERFLTVQAEWRRLRPEVVQCGIDYSRAESSVQPEARPKIGERRTMRLFAARAEWLRNRLDERAWSKNDVFRHGGPDRKTVQKILDGEEVRPDVLDRLARALSKKNSEVTLLEIPRI